jgi:hypothetical protein
LKRLELIMAQMKLTGTGLEDFVRRLELEEDYSATTLRRSIEASLGLLTLSEAKPECRTSKPSYRLSAKVEFDCLLGEAHASPSA